MKRSISPTQDSESNAQLALIARLYYVDGLAQGEVAKFAKVSQAKISRLLALAKERGIVKITVSDFEPRVAVLERQLRKELKLKQVIVIQAATGSSVDQLRTTVAHFGASIVHQMLLANSIVAIAGGRTIDELVQRLPEASMPEVSIVQAMGNVDSNLFSFDAQEVGRVMAHRLGATFLSLNTPAFVPDKRTRDALLRLEQVRDVQRALDNATIAMVGVGTLKNSVFVERGTLTKSMIRELQQAGAVGEICGRFYTAQGTECKTDWRDKVVSTSTEQLKKIPNVLAAVSGSDRTEAILGAIRGRIVKSLLIDELGAKSLLDATKIQPSRGASVS